jgi:hypothetical protein
MHLFLNQYRAPCGIRVAQHPVGYDPPILSVPLYAFERLPQLVAAVAGGGR